MTIAVQNDLGKEVSMEPAFARVDERSRVRDRDVGVEVVLEEDGGGMSR